MAITLSTAANEAGRNAACDAVVDLVDPSGSPLPANGIIVLRTGGSPEVALATLTFGNPAFGAASSGQATANAITNDSAATGDAGSPQTPCTLFTVEQNGAEIWRGTVAESGADLNIDDGTVGSGVLIEPNAVVSISSITFTVSFT